MTEAKTEKLENIKPDLTNANRLRSKAFGRAMNLIAFFGMVQLKTLWALPIFNGDCTFMSTSQTAKSSAIPFQQKRFFAIFAFSGLWDVFNAVNSIVAGFTDSFAIRYCKPQIRVLAPRFDMVGDKPPTTFIAFLTGIIIPRKNSLAPSCIFAFVSPFLPLAFRFSVLVIGMVFARLKIVVLFPPFTFASFLDAFKPFFLDDRIAHRFCVRIPGYFGFVFGCIRAGGRTKLLVCTWGVSKFFAALKTISIMWGILAFPRAVLPSILNVGGYVLENFATFSARHRKLVGFVLGHCSVSTFFSAILPKPVLEAGRLNKEHSSASMARSFDHIIPQTKNPSWLNRLLSRQRSESLKGFINHYRILLVKIKISLADYSLPRPRYYSTGVLL